MNIVIKTNKIKKLRISKNLIKATVITSLILLMTLLIVNDSGAHRLAISIFIANLIIIYVYPSKSIFTKFVSFIYFLVLYICVKENIIKFSFIPQARALLDIDKSLLVWFKSGHPHAVRLLVAYPGYILSQVFEMDLDLGFSYYVITMFNIIFLTMMNSLKKLKENKHRYLIEVLNMLCMFPVTLLAFLMNGRLVFAYLGFLMITDIFISIYTKGIKLNISKIIFLAGAFVLTTVSSGTLMVSLIYIMVMLYVYYYRLIDNPPSIRKQIFSLLILSPLLYIVFEYATIMFIRNVNYFGGGFKGLINMLNHGVGRFFILSQFQTIIFIALITIFLIMNFLFIKKQIYKKNKILPLILGINISMYGLLFGFSTGLMGVPPLIILILYYIN
ncbi:hypothetical protein [Tissierella sp.]|uniref:hypothetical protein n=1 Tax=Tissierella sp. TaxID=41274 RepID=UPI002864C075|nr:hypothetical protein [Tissierella sp.]MDR7857551.1 hypothetical protein [Tissierella sp.]